MQIFLMREQRLQDCNVPPLNHFSLPLHIYNHYFRGAGINLNAEPVLFKSHISKLILQD